LTNLQGLGLGHNQITDATPLEALLLNQKKAGKPILNILPFNFYHYNSLEGNPLQTPPMEVMDKGSEAFLEWVEENR
jgi:Leucine-rich repeat (LRR) protein